MEFVYFGQNKFPLLQTMGNASQFAIPYAKHFCKGIGYDIGFGQEEWKFPGAIGIDCKINNGYHALHLPDTFVDYIYSSHCLEHVDDWVRALEYWISKIRIGGVLFLYLPDFSQQYWRPWNNRKHRHCLTIEIVREFLIDHNMKHITIGGIDMNSSFMIVCEK